jgi:hypothetical protein
MKTYFIGERIVEFETDSLKAAKAWATRNRYYLGRLRVPDITFGCLTVAWSLLRSVSITARRAGRNGRASIDEKGELKK